MRIGTSGRPGRRAVGPGGAARWGPVVAGAVALLLVGGCGPADDGAAPTQPPPESPSTDAPGLSPRPPSPGPPAGSATPPAASGPSSEPPSADDVRRAGQAVTVGATTIHVLTGSGSALADLVTEEGSLTLSVPLSPGVPAPVQTSSTQGSPAQGPPASGPPVLLLAGPDATTARVLVDGTAVLRDAAGAVVVGVVAEGARLRAAGDGVVEVVPLARADGLDGADGADSEVARVLVGTDPVLSGDWADRGDEGGLSLAVVPRPWVRTAGAAGVEAVWSALGRQEGLGSDATAPGMRDQLECHAIGAPDKESWNLEPWRPDVGLLATLGARCNPT